jgi:multidrug resistance efflux pump
MTLIALPGSVKSRRRLLPLGVAAVVALLAVGTLWAVTQFRGRSTNALVAGKFHPVAAMDLDVKVAKDGELQAVNNVDVLNQVEGVSTIVEIVKEGAVVKKGDTLVELDSSEIRQKIEDATLELQKAEADLVTAKEMRSIQESENAANREAAEVEVELAALALKQYVEGTYPQEFVDAETAVRMAEITVKNKDEDLEQTRALYAKGFVTGSDVQQGELAVTTAHNELASARTKLKVLRDYSYPSELASKKSTLVQAEQALARVQKKNASQLSQVIADEKASELALIVKKRRLDHLNTQLGLCVIKAPTDGLVVYAGDRNNQQGQIIEGAQVRERQRLLHLPDTSSMKAVVRINESHVPKLQIGQKASVKIVGVPRPISATLTKISPLADSAQRWWNPDLKEYPVELTLDQTPRDVKPGIGLQAEIFTNRLDGVLAVPLAAVYSDRSASYVFVRDGADGAKPVPVQIGEANETHARIEEGLKLGQDVLILAAGQGRDLLERAGITSGPSGSDRPGRRGGENGAETAPEAEAAEVVAEGGGTPAAPAPAPANAGTGARSPADAKKPAPAPAAAPKSNETASSPTEPAA